MHQTVSDSEKESIIQKLKQIPENSKCFDCHKKNPTWASPCFGIFLCMDCATAHREFGAQYSSVHSFQYDTWTQKQLLSLELGGNAKALEYFKKHGQKSPYDYKDSSIQNYKAELAKKVDAALIARNSNEKAAQYNKGISMSLSNLDHFDAKFHGEHNDEISASLDNLDKVAPKKRGSVEFTNSKNSSSKKGGISARRIADIDIDSLTLQNDSDKFFKDMMGPSDPQSHSKSGVKEVLSRGNSSENQGDEHSKFEGLRDAKGISSDVFKENQNIINQENNKPEGGDKEKELNNSQKVLQAAGNVKGFITQIGGKVGGGVSSLGGKLGGIGGALKSKVGNILHVKRQKENVE